MSDEIVGETHYKGDVRDAHFVTAYSDRHGLVHAVSSEYDEEADLTTVHWAEGVAR